MVLSRSIKEQMLKHCGSICEDDGASSKSEKKAQAKKTEEDNIRQLRLCRQIERALCLAMSSCPAVSLRNVEIMRVVPGDNTSYLYVEVALRGESTETKRYVLAELKSVCGWLRCEIAKTISRRQVPQLRFRWHAEPGGNA